MEDTSDPHMSPASGPHSYINTLHWFESYPSDTFQFLRVTKESYSWSSVGSCVGISTFHCIHTGNIIRKQHTFSLLELIPSCRYL